MSTATTPSRQRSTLTPTHQPKSPARLAFERALVLVRMNGVLDLEVAPLNMYDGHYYAHLEEVQTVLQRAKGTRVTDTDALCERIADRSLSVTVSDAITAVRTDAYDSGYLYGLAMGLVLADKGGVR